MQVLHQHIHARDPSAAPRRLAPSARHALTRQTLAARDVSPGMKMEVYTRLEPPHQIMWASDDWLNFCGFNRTEVSGQTPAVPPSPDLSPSKVLPECLPSEPFSDLPRDSASPPSPSLTFHELPSRRR